MFSVVPSVFASTYIPSQAWSRDIDAGGYTDGAPVGGFGAGSYTWNFAGDFYLSRLNIATAPTTWTNNNPYTVDGNCGFYMYQKPLGQAAVTYRLDAAALGTGQANYYSLFPKAWVDYYGSDFACKARVTQFTPLIPGDYTRSSYPEGIYEWDLSNPTCTTTDVAIMLTWDNSFGGTTAAVTTSGSDTGLVLTRTSGSATSKSQGEFTLACSSGSGVTVTYQSATGVAALQTSFGAAGTLNNTVGNNTIGGIAFKVTLAPGKSVKIPIVLAWDIPLAQPGTGAQWYREYTRTYGKTGLNSFSIANEALSNYATWESSIDSWQVGILGGPYPDWFKQMLFNELYYYVIGGTLWEAGQYGSTQFDAGPDMFSSLESYVYTFYGTSDVRFYSSWALAENWPNIDKQEVEQFCDSVTINSSQTLPRPVAIGTCAHDFGSLNDVFTAWNDYTYRDSTTWKDLNSKLVLMVYRDWQLTGQSDSTFLNYCWPAIQVAMAKVHSQCVSGGVTYNLPISNGIDQTYDNLGLTGETSYCGSLYLAACEAAQAIATTEGNGVLATTYQSWLTLGQSDFEGNLWNTTGNYYNIDTGSGAGGVTGVARIMSDQLCGQWYAKACGLADVVPATHAVSAWQAVHDNNWAKFDAGAHGEVNVMTSAGNIDTSTSQTQEAWVGTTWGAVAGMIQEGMFTQAVSIGNSLYNSVWNLGQMWYRTPEAWTTGLTNIRAPYYMRANAIWGAKHAYDVTSPCGSASCTPIPTFTPVPTATLNCPTTATPTPTATGTATLTPSKTASPSPSSTITFSPTSSVTKTLTSTPTSSLTGTPTWTSTLTSTKTASASPTQTISQTASSSATSSATYTATNSRTSTPISSSTASWTSTPTFSSTATPTSTTTQTLTRTPTATMTSTTSYTVSPTFSMTASLTPSETVTSTATSSRTSTPSLTPTPSTTATPTGTVTSTLTITSTATETPTTSSSSTAMSSQTPSATATTSLTPSTTFTPTLTVTETSTPSLTTTPSATSSSSQTSSPTLSFTVTSTVSSSATSTASPTVTLTPTGTKTPTPTLTATSSATSTASATPTMTWTKTSTPSQTPSTTLTFTVTTTSTASSSFTPSSTPSTTTTATSSVSATMTPTPIFTVTFTPTASAYSSPVTLLPPYPNPDKGGEPVTIAIEVPGPVVVTWKVFTTAFRMIDGGTSSFSGNGTIQWDMKDKLGIEAAGGLYYIRVEVQTSGGTTRKIFKILVIR